jgi:hypothetical protein
MSADRQEAVQRKGEVQAALGRVQRELAHAETQAATLTGLRGKLAARRLARLQAEADALMAEEARLRLLIDRSR